MNQAHVFVCYGSQSLDAATRLAGAGGTPLERSYFLLLFDADCARLPHGAIALTMNPLPHALSEWQKPFAIARWFSSCLERLAADQINNIHAYIPHPFEIPGNHFAYFDQRVSQLDLLPDGLVNFTSAELRPESLSKQLRLEVRLALRVLAMRACGLAYKPLRAGHLTQFHSLDYAHAWTDQPVGYLTARGAPDPLPGRRDAEPTASPPGSPIVLIIDQELSQLVSPDLEGELRAQLIRQVSSLKPTKVYYKAHPRGKNRLTDYARVGLAAEDISGRESAEEFLRRQAVSDLFGFYSTPLLQTQWVGLQRWAVLPLPSARGVKKRKSLSDIRDTLQASGAEILGPANTQAPPRA